MRRVSARVAGSRRRVIAFVGTAACMLVAVTATAQSNATGENASTAPSAATAGTASGVPNASAAPSGASSSSQAAVASGAPPGLNSPELAEAARRLFREGAQLANQGRWEEARDRFLRAIAVRPSPLLRFNLAIAAQNSGHFVEAIDAYRQFLLDDIDPANALRRQEAQTAITAIENVLATLVITVQGTDPVAQVRLDGRVLPSELLGVEIPVDPTEHVIDASGTRGSSVRQLVRLGEGASRRIALRLEIPPGGMSLQGTAHAATGSSSRPAAAPAPPARPAVAPPGTIERVRRFIEDRSSTPDEFGRRRWARTFVAYAFQSIGSPVGLLGAGIRWAARPWFELEFQGGAGHPFGPGLGVFLSGRSPWSYRYALGLQIGVSTNFTNLPMGVSTTQPPGTCRPDAPFTPFWFHAAITHEWRVSMGLAFRFAAGVRFLVNGRELEDALTSHCTPRVPFDNATYVVLDPPGLDRAVVPMLPWLSFDIGYSL